LKRKLVEENKGVDMIGEDKEVVQEMVEEVLLLLLLLLKSENLRWLATPADKMSLLSVMLVENGEKEF